MELAGFLKKNLCDIYLWIAASVLRLFVAGLGF